MPNIVILETERPPTALKIKAPLFLQTLQIMKPINSLTSAEALQETIGLPAAALEKTETESEDLTKLYEDNILIDLLKEI